MIDQIIFLHSKGSETKRKIIKILYQQDKEARIHCLTTLADNLSISKVAIKKHVDYLNYMGYIYKINPNGKPVFLKLTSKGVDVIKKYPYVLLVDNAHIEAKNYP